MRFSDAKHKGEKQRGKATVTVIDPQLHLPDIFVTAVCGTERGEATGSISG